ncbi:MAG: ribonuclease H-like domain-containing protein [Armatimonadota bacterium]|nr:ribonuclease H-like domain-containing protein [Armatimonadota bacterium]
MLDAALRKRLRDIARGNAPSPPCTPPAEQLDEITPDDVTFEFDPHPVTNDHGELALAETSAGALCGNSGELASRFLLTGAALGCDPCRALVLDLETTGLSHVPMFLAGTLYVESDDLRIRQIFARTYAEEKALICELGKSFAECDLVITYNGNSFDLPYVRNRAAAHLLPVAIPERRLDVLHAARRAWRGRVPDCRLQTLESCVCRRSRTGDIPGHLIPRTYHEYVRTGDIAPLLPVFQHNALDLLTTLELLLQLFGR